MFSGRNSNKGINHLSEMTLRIGHQDQNSSLEQLFKKDHFYFVHHLNIKNFAIELLKVFSRHCSTQTINQIFQFREKNYNAWTKTYFTTIKVNAVKSLNVFAARLWNIVPDTNLDVSLVAMNSNHV